MSPDQAAQAGPSTQRGAAIGPRSDHGSVQEDDAEPGAESVSRSASPIGNNDHRHEQSHRARKRAQVRHACWTCRTDKVKCSGTHPTCSRCRQRNVHCTWDVPQENMTKMQHLRTNIRDAERRLELVNTIFEILQKGSDEAAAEALARLRIGQSVDEVVNYMATAQTQDISDTRIEPKKPTTG